MANYISDSTKIDPNDKKKKQITPEKIYDAISNSNKGGLWGGIILSFVILIMMLIFVLVVNISGMEQKWATLVNMLLLSVPLAMVMIFLYLYYRDTKMLAEGGYKIITDTAERVVTDDRYVRYGRHSYMEHAMYLYNCGRVVISLQETYTNSEGDTFYVVVSKKRPRTALFAYNSKYYELVDLKVEQ